MPILAKFVIIISHHLPIADCRTPAGYGKIVIAWLGIDSQLVSLEEVS